MYDKSVINRENLPSNSIEAAYFNERFTILTSFTKQRNIDRYVHMCTTLEFTLETIRFRL